MKPETLTLIQRASAGEDAAFAELCAEYEPLIRSMSKKYASMSGAADEVQVREDFSQEATLALFRAARTYEKREGKVSFGLYAKVCIRNALISELRRIEKKKRADREQKENIKLERQSAGILPDKFEVSGFSAGELSPFEKKVFAMYLNGVKVKDIANALGRSSKSVSNAVYRIKSKMRLSLDRDHK